MVTRPQSILSNMAQLCPIASIFCLLHFHSLVVTMWPPLSFYFILFCVFLFLTLDVGCVSASFVLLFLLSGCGSLCECCCRCLCVCGDDGHTRLGNLRYVGGHTNQSRVGLVCDLNIDHNHMFISKKRFSCSVTAVFFFSPNLFRVCVCVSVFASRLVFLILLITTFDQS